MVNNTFITTKDAARRFQKSISTIKRVVATAPHSVLQYEPSRTAKNRRLFISIKYLEGKFLDIKMTPTQDQNHEVISILQKELQDKQNTIDRLLDANTKIQEDSSVIIKQLTENEERFQILLERENQKSKILEEHFQRNKKSTPNIEEELIEEVIQEEASYFDNESNFIDVNNEKSFQDWIKSMKQ